jgi:uncharacterized spore protein YtfJ
MPLEEIVKQVAETIQKEANARAVFGEATKLDTHVLIPVASVTVNISGGGGGGARRPAQEIARLFGGGSGALNVVSTPVGFIHEKDGQVVFTRIEKGEDKVLPQFAERIVSVFAPREKKGVETAPVAEKVEKGKPAEKR